MKGDWEKWSDMLEGLSIVDLAGTNAVYKFRSAPLL